MKTVYAIVNGAYSSFTVHGVCEDPVKAQAICDHLNTFHPWTPRHEESINHDEFRVQDMVMVEGVEDLRPLSTFSVGIDTEGNEVERSGHTDMLWYVLPDDHPTETTNDNLDPRDPEGFVTGYSSRSYDEALKAARDRLAVIRAEQAGLLD